LQPGMRPSTEPQWIGPYTIVRRTLYGPYILRDDTGDIYGRQVNIDQMKVVYSATHVPASRQNEEEDTYVVDYIIEHREVDGVFKYKVKWKGYDVKEATWETEDQFNDPQPIERYFKLLAAKQQAKRAKINTLCDHCGPSPLNFLNSRH
jgi:hypothetical protein